LIAATGGGGASAKSVFKGLGIGALYTSLISFLYLWPSKVQVRLPLIKKAVVGVSTTPALLGVGYILGRRIGAIMVGGGLISWVLLIPFIAWKFGDMEIWPNTLIYLRSKGLDPAITTISGLSAQQIWDGYIRIIGAGAVAAAGIITVVKSIPTMVNSLKIGVKELRTSAAQLDAGRLRTERDLSIKYVILGVALVVLVVTFLPGIIGNDTHVFMRFCSAVAIAIFAFCFVTVSSRIVGMIGVSSNPTSGMAIVTLLGTGLIFKLLGWTDLTGKITALTIGTIVCISASIAGDISQDLKTGFIVGATPRKQQISEIIGALGSAFFVCLAVFYLGKAYGFGTEQLPAPQATLMKTVLDGVLDGNLRWDLVGIGAAFSVVIMLFKIPPLPFAVGIYLPLHTMTPVFIGGVIRHLVDSRSKRGKEDVDLAGDNGILLGSGLIAGEGLLGVVIAIIAVIMTKTPEFLVVPYSPAWIGQIISALIFCGLGYYLYKIAIRSKQVR
jgi:putative OPT family oligopeptide transporter